MKSVKLTITILPLVVLCSIIFERITKPETTAIMTSRAEQTARTTINTLPKNQFTQDGCSLFPDTFFWLDFKEACLSHDIAYWIGGTPLMRKKADRIFLAELKETGVLNTPFAYIMYSGVRLFGDTFLLKPFDANWGYGWN